MKKIFTICLILCLIFTAVLNGNISASANTSGANNNDVAGSYSFFNDEATSSNLYVTEYCHNIGAEIALVISFSLPNEITNIIFEGNGFDLEKNFEIINNKVYFSVKHIETYETPYLRVEIFGEGEASLSENLYGIVRGNQLFVDSHSYYFAERAYQDYLKNTAITLEETFGFDNIKLDADARLKNNEKTEIASNEILPDTIVNGTLNWEDSKGEERPLRFVRIWIYKTDVSPIELIYAGCTDKNGQFTCAFLNDSVDGKSDLALVVSASGMDVEIYDSYGNAYLSVFYAEDVPSLKDIPATTHTVNISTFNANESGSSEEYKYFCQALQISQSAISTAIFYEDMKESDIEDVKIVYPHSENYNNTFYMWSNKTIYVEEETTGSLCSYEACDVITHEYGHHISYCENITAGVGGSHGLATDMAEHYKSHFYEESLPDNQKPSGQCGNNCSLKHNNANGTNFAESECKLKGCQIAWSEGFATFIGEIAQQYFYENYISTSLNNVKPIKFSDGYYSSYANDVDSSLETKKASKYSESIEETVFCLLYDMYDGASTGNIENFDKISLSYTVLWNLITESGTYTLYEFVELFKQTHNNKDNIIKLGELLSEMDMPYSDFEIEDFNTFAPTVRVKWLERNSVYNWRLYQINFYDYYDLELIGNSDTISMWLDHDLNGYISIDENLWSDIIKEHGKFYITLTVYECDGDIDLSETDNRFITCYESKYIVYDVKALYTVISRNYEGTHDLTYTQNSNVGKYHWYSFTVPSTEEYVFQISTSMDIILEIFPGLVVGNSTEGRLYASGQLGGFGECKITANLLKNQTIYIRVGGLAYNGSGEYTLSITTPNHVHSYNSSYKSTNENSHKSYCICGDYITESHQFISSGVGYRCNFCNYFTKFIMVPIAGKKPNIDICNFVVYNKDE